MTTRDKDKYLFLLEQAQAIREGLFDDVSRDDLALAYARVIEKWSGIDREHYYAQSDAISEGRFEDLDREQTAEEVQEMAEAEYHSLVIAILMLLRDLLIDRDEGGMDLITWRLNLCPSLDARLDEAATEAWQEILEMRGKLEIPTELPETCPYSIRDVLSSQEKRG